MVFPVREAERCTTSHTDIRVDPLWGLEKFQVQDCLFGLAQHLPHYCLACCLTAPSWVETEILLSAASGKPRQGRTYRFDLQLLPPMLV